MRYRTRILPVFSNDATAVLETCVPHSAKANKLLKNCIFNQCFKKHNHHLYLLEIDILSVAILSSSSVFFSFSLASDNCFSVNPSFDAAEQQYSPSTENPPNCWSVENPPICLSVGNPPNNLRFSFCRSLSSRKEPSCSSGVALAPNRCKLLAELVSMVDKGFLEDLFRPPWRNKIHVKNMILATLL